MKDREEWIMIHGTTIYCPDKKFPGLEGEGKIQQMW